MTDILKAAERRFCFECMHGLRSNRNLFCHRHQVTVYSEVTGEWLPAFGDPIPTPEGETPCGQGSPAWVLDPALLVEPTCD